MLLLDVLQTPRIILDRGEIIAQYYDENEKSYNDCTHKDCQGHYDKHINCAKSIRL